MPSLPDNYQSCDSHLADVLARNIVTRVLEEAQDIANIANNSGQSWRYVWCQKKGNKVFYENAEILGVIKGDNDTEDNEVNQINKVVITSTPQKEIEDNIKSYHENGLIGQGDEDIQNRNIDMRSPSMLINSLFDMSELDDSVTFEVSEDVQNDSDSRDFYACNIAKLVESYVNLALNTACERQSKSNEDSSNSSYSLLADATDNEVTANLKLYIDRIKSTSENQEITTLDTKLMGKHEGVEEILKKDIELYGTTFSTLNRDYDKCFEDEDHFLEERKSLTMHDVELTTNISLENLASQSEPVQSLTEEGPVMEAHVGHKKSIIKRCRQQGAKLISRLRIWWWKQRLIGKRKERRSGLIPGLCPLTPSARSRAASLLDHRKLRSPSPLRTLAWKFNTINDALIHSYNRKGSEMDITYSDRQE